MSITPAQAGGGFFALLLIVAIILMIVYLPNKEDFVCTFNNMSECTPEQIEDLIGSSCPE